MTPVPGPALIIAVDGPAASGKGTIAKALARLRLPVPRVLRLVPAPGELRLFARAARYETTRARTDLGFRAAIPLSDGLRRP